MTDVVGAQRSRLDPVSTAEWKKKTRSVVWRAAWKFQMLREGGSTHGIDYEERALTRAEVRLRPLAVIGEEGSGRASLRYWWESNHVPGVDVAHPPVASHQELVERLRERLGTRVARGAQRGDHQAPVKRPQTRRGTSVPETSLTELLAGAKLVVEGLDLLKDPFAVDCFSEIRGAVESGQLGESLIVLYLSTIDSIHHNVLLPFSYVLGGTIDLARIAPWGPDELVSLGLPEDLTADCLEWTGGVPVLVQAFLEQRDRQASATPEAIGARLRDVPPADQKHWVQRLAELVREPVTRHLVEALADQDELSQGGEVAQFEKLFASGWVRRVESSGERRWRIRSQCHRAWARNVLRGTMGRTP